MTNTVHSCGTVVFRISIVAAYIFAGSGIFYILEKNNTLNDKASNSSGYNETVKDILQQYKLNETEIDVILGNLTILLPPQPPRTPWSFMSGVELSIQTITTIGYGTVTPKTVYGRMFLILYAIIGIPLMAMMLTAISQKTKRCINVSLIFLEKKLLKRNEPQHIKGKSIIAICVLTITCLVLVSWISVVIEKDWDFSVAIYFWFVTFTTIGFGDVFPSGSGSKGLLIFQAIFVSFMFFFGLALMATIVSTVGDFFNATKLPIVNSSFIRSVSSMQTRELEMSDIQKDTSASEPP